MWDDEFELCDELYSVLGIQNYFKYNIKNMEH